MPPSEADLATQADDLPTRPEATRPRALIRGDTLGRYVVLERIGVGGMGEVFAAYDPELDRKIAVKLLLASTGDPGASTGPARLLREAQAMARLRHRNVITVHDVGTHEGRVFVAMEFVEGGTLADWIRGEDEPASDARHPRHRHARHPWPAVLERFGEAGRGLAAAHAAGLIHRDFKPANVLVGRDGRVLVADFGLVRRVEGEPVDESARELSSQVSSDAALELASDALANSALANSALANSALASSELASDATLLAEPNPPSSTGASLRSGSHDSLSLRMTQTGATLGTPAYMAPEQYRGGSVDARADQFSFCVAVWEALYGQRPFAGESPHALMFAVLAGTIREPADERGVPTPIRRALQRGLANQPDQRWPDMDALLAALRWDPSERRRRLTIAGLAVVLAGATVVGLLNVPEAPPPIGPPPPPCLGAEQAFGDVFPQARRDQIAAHFGGFEHGWARDFGTRLFPRLDAWTLAWQATWTDACEATRVRGEQSEDLFDRRMLCLDRERRGFVVLLGALEQADESLAKRTDSVFDELATLDRCSDEDALLRVTPLPDDPAQAAAVLRAEAVLDGATKEYLAARYPQARALLEAQRELVEQIDYAPLLAGFEHLDGRLAITLEDRSGGEQLLERAFLHALAAGDDDLALDVARSLATSLNQFDRGKDALRWLDIAAALIERTGNDDYDLGRLGLIRCQTLAELGDYPGSEAAAQDAYARLQRTVPNTSKVGDALYLLGVAAYRAGRLDQAVERVEQARTAWSAEIGPRHPRTGAALTLLAVASRAQGKHPEAQAYFEAALAIEVANLGPDHIEVAGNMMNLAVSFADQGKLTEAIAMLQRVLAIYRAQPEPSAAEIGRAQVNLSRILHEAGRFTEARAAIDEGESLLRGVLGDEHPDLVVVIHTRAEIDLARGELADAERAARDAIRLAKAKYEPDNPALADLYTTAAEISLARNQPREAKKWLDAIVTPHSNPEHRARREFVAAQVLAALDQAEPALASARAAKASLAESSGSSAELMRAKLDKWLAAHE